MAERKTHRFFLGVLPLPWRVLIYSDRIHLTSSRFKKNKLEFSIPLWLPLYFGILNFWMKPSGDQAWGGWRLLRVGERNILNIPPSPPPPLCPPTIFYWRLTLMLISIKNMHFWWISAFASTHIAFFAFEIAIKLLKNIWENQQINFISHPSFFSWQMWAEYLS